MSQNVESLSDRAASRPAIAYTNTNWRETSRQGGDGGSGMLEARVARLEDDVKDIKADLKVLRADVSDLKGKVSEISGKISNLPGWPGLLAIASLIIAAVGLMLRFFPPSGPTP